MVENENIQSVTFRVVIKNILYHWNCFDTGVSCD